MVDPTIVIVPSGQLGTGMKAEELKLAVAMKPHAFASDAGSTDSGASFLATGRSKNSRSSLKREMAMLMDARAAAGVPLLIGSCGSGGGDAGVDFMLEITLEVAKDQGRPLKIAVLYSEQDKDVLKAKAAAGAITPLAPFGDITNADIDGCEHIVALMGPEPLIAAVEQGADIVLAGRTTDTAVLAAVPLMRGAHAGASWHAAKVTECGGQCTLDVTCPGVAFTVGDDGFTVAPLALANKCTPYVVSAHMLYENSNPFQLVEPGGILNVKKARYEQLDDRTVAVTGSVWNPMPYTMKLEGSGIDAYQTIMIEGIEDPEVMEDVDRFLAKMNGALRERVVDTMGAESAADIDVFVRAYGWNAVSGLKRSPDTPPPLELGLLFTASAPTQAMATETAKSCNSYFFHMPPHEMKELPTYAFPFSPAQIELGPVHSFRLNHVVHTTSPHELVRTRWVTVDASPEEQTREMELLNGQG